MGEFIGLSEDEVRSVVGEEMPADKLSALTKQVNTDAEESGQKPADVLFNLISSVLEGEPE